MLPYRIPISAQMGNKRKFMGITHIQNSHKNYFPIFLNHVIENNRRKGTPFKDPLIYWYYDFSFISNYYQYFNTRKTLGYK